MLSIGNEKMQQVSTLSGHFPMVRLWLIISAQRGHAHAANQHGWVETLQPQLRLLPPDQRKVVGQKSALAASFGRLG